MDDFINFSGLEPLSLLEMYVELIVSHSIDDEDFIDPLGDRPQPRRVSVQVVYILWLSFELITLYDWRITRNIVQNPSLTSLNKKAPQKTEISGQIMPAESTYENCMSSAEN